MKKLYTLFLLVTLSITATAQYNTSWSWVKLTTANKAYSLTPDQSGHYTFSGRFAGNAYFDSLNIATDPRQFNGFFVRYDSNGNALWLKQFGDTSTFFVDQVRTAIDTLGNTYIAGTFNGRLQIDSVVMQSRAIQEIFLIKLKPNGQLDWAKQLGTEPLPIYPGPQQPIVQSDGITLDQAGNCYITGLFYDSLNIDTVHLDQMGYNTFIAKFSPQGQLSWVKHSTGGRLVYTNGFTSDSQGNCIIGGIFNHTITFNGDTLRNNQSTAFIIKINPQGQNVWAKKIDGKAYCNAIAVDPSDNIYLTGSFWDSAYFYPTPFYSNGSSDAYVAKYDNLGNIIWAIQDSGDYASGKAVFADNQHVYVAGNFNGSAFSNTPYAISAHPARSELFFALLDASQGQPLSVIRPGTAGSSSGDQIIGLHADSIMNVYVAGNSANGSTLAGVYLNGGFFLAKLNYSRISGLAEVANNVSHSVYPNPATEQATITLSGYSQQVKLEMLDVTGRIITVPVQQSLQGESQQLQLNTATLPKGLYLYRLVHEGELVAMGKLVKD